VLRIKQIRSSIGRNKKKKRTLSALGLKHLNDTVIQPDNPAIRGMLRKVSEIVKVEEIPGG